jgi:hypothetical protein
MPLLLATAMALSAVAWAGDGDETSSPAANTEVSSCEQVGVDAGAAVLLKHAQDRAVKAHAEKQDSGLESWQMIALLVGKDLRGLGWHKDQINAFARSIVAGGPYRDEKEEAYAAELYFRKACEMRAAGKAAPPPYESLTPRLRQCLAGKRTDQAGECVDRVLAGQ